ncbi:MAG: hypothetical protein ATN34_04040 [Epulopiscium sp. Nele67-Bin002]|nr:MAG: hypothetical protein ATN34_04040 [Epulopiscium sp. Nele67-Bin002]OON94442.1 MAG: hypothetical protein ATN33_04430 [Epulopiscium sp. Nele67-Bin001]
MFSWFNQWLKYNRRRSRGTVTSTKYDSNDIDSLFESLKSTTLKLHRQEEQLEQINSLKRVVDMYLELDQKTHNQLKNYAVLYRDSVDEKTKLKARLIRNNPALQRLVEYEEEIPTLIRELKSVENQIHICKSNIEYLREEKEQLIEDRETLIGGYKFLKVFTAVFLLVLGLSFVLVITMLQVLRNTLWIYVGSIICVFMVFIVLLIIAKDRLEKALVKNELLQKKAAKYIQKYQIHYYQQQSYLDYEFKKLDVDSIDQLETYFERYTKNKVHETKYDTYVNNMMISENQISEILGNNQFNIRGIERIQEWLVNPHKLEEAKSIVSSFDSVNKQVDVLKIYEKDLYKQILAYGEVDQYKDMIAGRLEEYYQWTERALDRA